MKNDKSLTFQSRIKIGLINLILIFLSHLDCPYHGWTCSFCSWRVRNSSNYFPHIFLIKIEQVVKELLILKMKPQTQILTIQKQKLMTWSKKQQTLIQTLMICLWLTIIVTFVNSLLSISRVLKFTKLWSTGWNVKEPSRG